MLLTDTTEFKTPNTNDLYYFEYDNPEMEDIYVRIDTPLGTISIATLKGASKGIIPNIIIPRDTFKVVFPATPTGNPIHFTFAVMPSLKD